MKHRAALLGIVAVAFAAGAAGARPPGLGVVRDVRHWSYRSYTRVVIELSRPIETEPQELPPHPADGAPARLYVDLPGIWVGRSRDEPIPVRDGLLRRVRIGQNTLDTTRVVLDLDHYERYRLLELSGPDRIVLDVFGRRDPAPEGAASGPDGARVAAVPPAVRPSMEFRPVRTVVVDPGHGGSDPGAIGWGGLREKDVTLRLARMLRRALVARGFQVVLTRDRDETLSLLDRTAIAEGVGGDVFVSIHANAAPNRTADGVEVYTLDENARRQTLRLAARENGVTPAQVDPLQRLLTRLRVSEASQRSDQLADLVWQEIAQGMGRHWPSVRDGRGRLRGPFYVLYLSDMPSVLVEAGFVTHKGDARRLHDPDYLDAMADRIARGIDRFRDHAAPVVAEQSQ
jgi:N-acetylmuramoyl-L-alanine amidase